MEEIKLIEKIIKEYWNLELNKVLIGKIENDYVVSEKTEVSKIGGLRLVISIDTGKAFEIQSSICASPLLGISCEYELIITKISTENIINVVKLLRSYIEVDLMYTVKKLKLPQPTSLGVFFIDYPLKLKNELEQLQTKVYLKRPDDLGGYKSVTQPGAEFNSVP